MHEKVTLYAGPLDGSRDERAIDPDSPDTLTVTQVVYPPAWQMEATGTAEGTVYQHVYTRKAGSVFQYSHTEA